MRWALLLITLAGCIDSELVPCGELACPADTECGPYGGCVFPTQFTACEQLAHGDACTFNDTAGLCRDDLCEPLGCGNEVQSVDEVCDDGNTINGDDCSADCRSLETCGNGISDFGRGEECDDGNTADGDDCRSDCRLPRCGDGVVDGIEECDPAATLTTTHTCDEFGYYSGALGCSSICRLDPTTCIGRCGDGIVQPGVEGCDGAPPATESCLDYGFDFGALTCASVCTPDPNRSCSKLAWRDLGMMNGIVAPTLGFAADGDLRVHFVYASAQIFEAGTSTAYASPTPIYDADVLGTTIVLATATEVVRRANSAGSFVALPALQIDAGSGIKGVALADDGTVFALIASAASCRLDQLTTAWTTVTTLPSCLEIVARSATTYAIRTTDGVEWTAGGTTRSVAGSTRTVKLVGDTALEAYRSSGGTVSIETVPLVGPSSTEILATGFPTTALVVSGRAAYAFDTQLFNVRAIRGLGGRIESFAGPPSTTGAPIAIYVARSGEIYGTSNQHLYVHDAPMPTSRAVPANDLIDDATFALGTAGELVLCGKDVWLAAGATFQKLSTTSVTSCSATWVRTATDFYVAPGGQLAHFDGTSLNPETNGGAPLAVTALTGDATSVIAVLAAGGVARKTTTWELLPALPTGCLAKTAAVAGSIHAAGQCGSDGVIWRLDGTTWTELRRRPTTVFTSLHVTPSALIFAGSFAGIEVGSGASWSTFAISRATVAGAGGEVYATRLATGAILHWDSNRWTPVRVPSNMSFSKIAVSGTDVALLGGIAPAPLAIWYGLVFPPP